MNRFSSKNNYIYINQTNHGLNIGDLITINNGLYTKATFSSSNILGIIFEPSIKYLDNSNNWINDLNYFSFKPFYNYLSSNKINSNLSGTIGSIFYLDNLGNFSQQRPSINPYNCLIQITSQGDFLILQLRPLKCYIHQVNWKLIYNSIN